MKDNAKMKTIEELNADFLLDDVTVLWSGTNAILLLNGKHLTYFSALEGDLVAKITRWCRKNSYRCTQIQNGRIMV